MAHIVLADAQTWLEGTKAHLTALDPNLETQISNDVLARCSTTFPDLVSTWVDNNTTPALVKMVIAMNYAGWFYDRQFSEMITSSPTTWGMVLRANAETILDGIISGSVVLPEVIAAGSSDPQTDPIFYPTDVSSTTQALEDNTDPDDNSLGPAAFGMQKVF